MRSYSYCQKSWKNTKQSTTKMGSNRISTLCVGLVPGLRVRACWRERSKSTTSTRGRTILRQKEYYLSASQERPMLTTGVDRSGLVSVTHDETRVKSSCFLHMHVDSQFQVMKAWQQQRFATMIDNIRRFGGTIQGGLHGRTQCKLVIEGGPSPNKAMPSMEPLLTVLVLAMRSCVPTFTPCRIFGMSGRKPTSQFTSQERGGHGVNKKKQRCCHWKHMWDVMDRLIREGDTVDSAIANIKAAWRTSFPHLHNE